MATTTRGENVYECDTCARRNRVPENKFGMDVLPNCNITLGCLGKLRRVFNARDINLTPAIPPEVPGVNDWFQRRSLYTHTQQIADSEWLIKHDLANKPVVHAYVNKIIDGETQLVTEEPTLITTVDLNTTLLTFPTPYSGIAQCISLATQNITNPDATNPVVPVAQTVQMTSDAGELTIATLDDSPAVGLTLSYITHQGTVNIDYINVDNIVSVDSPWVNARQAIIAGRKYTLRSFNLTTTPLAQTVFSRGLIPSGTGFYINTIGSQPVTPGSVLILLGKSPYTAIDRVLDKYVDAYYVDKTSPQTLFDTGKGFALPTIVKKTYPSILVVG